MVRLSHYSSWVPELFFSAHDVAKKYTLFHFREDSTDVTLPRSIYCEQYLHALSVIRGSYCHQVGFPCVLTFGMVSIAHISTVAAFIVTINKFTCFVRF